METVLGLLVLAVVVVVVLLLGRVARTWLHGARIRRWARQQGWQPADPARLPYGIRAQVMDPLEPDYPNRELADLLGDDALLYQARTRFRHVLTGRVAGLDVTLVDSEQRTTIGRGSDRSTYREVRSHVAVAVRATVPTLSVFRAHDPAMVDNQLFVTGDAEFDGAHQMFTDDPAFAGAVLGPEVVTLLRDDPQAPRRVQFGDGFVVGEVFDRLRPARAVATAALLVDVLRHARARGARV